MGSLNLGGLEGLGEGDLDDILAKAAGVGVAGVRGVLGELTAEGPGDEEGKGLKAAMEVEMGGMKGAPVASGLLLLLLALSRREVPLLVWLEEKRRGISGGTGVVRGMKGGSGTGEVPGISESAIVERGSTSFQGKRRSG